MTGWTGWGGHKLSGFQLDGFTPRTDCDRTSLVGVLAIHSDFGPRDDYLMQSFLPFNHLGSHSSHTLQSTPTYSQTPPSTVTWIHSTHTHSASLSLSPTLPPLGLPSLARSLAHLPPPTHPPPSLYLASRSSIVYQSRHVRSTPTSKKKLRSCIASRYPRAILL